MSGTYKTITALDLMQHRLDAPGRHHVFDVQRGGGKTSSIIAMAQRLPHRCVIVYPNRAIAKASILGFTVLPIPATIITAESWNLFDLQDQLTRVANNIKPSNIADTVIFDESTWFPDKVGVLSVIRSAMIPNLLVTNFTTFYLGTRQ